MKTIHKFVLDSSETELKLPIGYQILDVQSQGGNYIVWIYLEDCADPDNEETVTILKVGTGWNLNDELLGDYIATVQNPGMGLVWHFFTKYPAKKG